MPAFGTIFCTSTVSHLNINALPVCATNIGSAGSSSDGGILGAVPHPVVCQICFSTDHSAITCPSRFTQPSAPALMTASGAPNSDLWFPDSGASAHMTASDGNLVNKSVYTGYNSVSVANGAHLQISHVGDVALPTSGHPLTLRSVYHVPQLKYNLISIQRLCADNNCTVIFDENLFLIKDKASGAVLLHAHSNGPLYPLRLPSSSSLALASVVASGPVWHRRLGHCGDTVLQFLKRQQFLCYHTPFTHECVACKLGKSQRLPFMDASRHSSLPLQLIHSDVWQSPVISNLGFKYYVCFIDDYSRFTWIYLLHQKREVFLHFKHFKALVENLFSQKIKVFQSDGCGEFVNSNIQQFFSTNGIYFQKSCPDTPQQNGVAERKHRHLLELTRTMLLEASVPNTFWVDALFTTAYIINRLPSPILNVLSPYQRLFQRVPNYAFMRVFGSACYPNFSATSANKLSARSVQCVFLGYAFGYKGYRCLDPLTGRIYVSRHVRFHEDLYPFQLISRTRSSDATIPIPHLDTPLLPRSSLGYSHPLPSSTTLASPVDPPSTYTNPSPHPRYSPTSDSSPSSVTASASASPSFSPSLSSPVGAFSDPISPSREPSASPSSAATSTPSPPVVNMHPMQTRAKAGIFKPKTIFNLSTIVNSADPNCFTEANKHLKWREAMADEFNALINNRTWDLVPFDNSKNIVGCKWIYKTKFHSDGSVERHKARLVAQGFNQQAGIDFSETFSPVIKPTTVRVVLTLAVSFGWVIPQLDVKNAFLHGHLTKEVYMRQPRGFIHPQFPNHICHLRKAIYGLKQAPRAWFHRFSSFLLQQGFCCSKSDNSLFIYRHNTSIIYLLLYVDDIIITGNSTSTITKFISIISNHFAMKDLGDLHYFLGIESLQSHKGLFLSHTKYITDLLHRFHLHTVKPIRTQLASRATLSLSDGELLSDSTEYRSMVGALQYLTLTRPDITYAVHLVSQFMHAPRTTHLFSVKRIFRYLQGTRDHGLWLQPSAKPICVLAYSDADWAGCPDSSRSTTGFAVFLGPNLISWKAKKQPTVSKSSTEAEYRAIAYTVQDNLHIRSVLVELGFPITEPVHLLCDNISASYLTANPIQHVRSKHIHIDYHFVRERVAHGDLLVKHIPTHLQLADIFTKRLPNQCFHFLKDNLHVVSPAQLDGV